MSERALTTSNPQEPVPYQAGDVIGEKYELTRLIGTGGMGTVWVARNLALDVNVAIKLIRSDRTAVGAAGRLLQEARAAARLRHPAIVQVFDFGLTDRSDPYLVMELLDGRSLYDALEEQARVSANRAVQTLLPVADALLTAHAKGVIHRDIKPDNIFCRRRMRGGRSRRYSTSAWRGTWRNRGIG